MVKVNFDLDMEENEKINILSKEWKLNKNETIKRIIRDFQINEFDEFKGLF